MAEVWLYFFVNICICHSFFTFLHFEVVVLVSIHLTGLPKDKVIGMDIIQHLGHPSVVSPGWLAAAAMVPFGLRTRCQMAGTTQAISSPLEIWTQQPQRQMSRHFELLYYLRNYEQVVAISVWFR